MNYDEIKKLIDDMGNSKLTSVDIQFPDGIKISMKKDNKELINYENIETKTTEVNVNNIENPAKIIKIEDYKTVKSPMVGTFYESSTPKSEPFVKLGDKVKKGDVLCIVEAMKLMNEIESEFDGEIIEICAKNEDIIDYGMTLFKIKE